MAPRFAVRKGRKGGCRPTPFEEQPRFCCSRHCNAAKQKPPPPEAAPTPPHQRGQKTTVRKPAAKAAAARLDISKTTQKKNCFDTYTSTIGARLHRSNVIRTAEFYVTQNFLKIVGSITFVARGTLLPPTTQKGAIFGSLSDSFFPSRE